MTLIPFETVSAHMLQGDCGVCSLAHMQLTNIFVFSNKHTPRCFARRRTLWMMSSVSTGRLVAKAMLQPAQTVPKLR